MFVGIVYEVGSFYFIFCVIVYFGLIDQGVDESWRMGGEVQVVDVVLWVFVVLEDIVIVVKVFW